MRHTSIESYFLLLFFFLLYVLIFCLEITNRIGEGCGVMVLEVSSEETLAIYLAVSKLLFGVISKISHLHIEKSIALC